MRFSESVACVILRQYEVNGTPLWKISGLGDWPPPSNILGGILNDPSSPNPLKHDLIMVSGADDGYFPYLQELILSLTGTSPRNFDIGILDFGLTQEQLAWLGERAQKILSPEWPSADFSGPSVFKASFCRPFLPRYFSEWNFIAWVDADTYLQDSRAIDLMLSGAKKYGFAVVPMVDRAYSPLTSSRTFTEWQREKVAWGFGPERADRLRDWPLISAGFVCGDIDAEQWTIWQTLITEALNRKIYFEAEQAALHVAIHERKMRVARLPSYVHWVCTAGQMIYDPKTGVLTEPFPPYEPLGMVALAANSKTDPWKLSTPDGRDIWRYLRASLLHSTVRMKGLVPGVEVYVDGRATPEFLGNVLSCMAEQGRTAHVKLEHSSSSLESARGADYLETPLTLLSGMRFGEAGPICIAADVADVEPATIVGVAGALANNGYSLYFDDDRGRVIAVRSDFLAVTLGMT